MEFQNMSDGFEQLRKSPYLKQHLNWNMALCQHMMYLLIDEDRGEPILGERVLPWGAPNTAEYTKRIIRNLKSLENIEDLILNYQIAAVDMESLARDYPQVADKMKDWHKKGRLDFVGGSFSQAHMQCIGSESNWRQFEWGTRLFQDMYGKQIKLYARQETGLHQQIPQILKNFGYEMIVMPQFPWAMEIVGGEFEIMSSHQGTSFIKEDEFVNALALDGTEMPAYLTGHIASFNDSDPIHAQPVIPAQHAHNVFNVKRGISKDLYGPPVIWPYFPDLMEVDREFYEEINEFCTLVQLEEAMLKRLAIAPPRAKAKVFSHWSYYEGEWAEELARTNKAAEENALLLESMQAMAKLNGIDSNNEEDIKAIWHTILKYQHHDVLWIAVTDLRRKAINYLKAGLDKDSEMMSEMAESLVEISDNSIAIFNSSPRPRRAMVEFSSGKVPTESLSLQEFNGKCFGFADLPAGGYDSFELSDKSACLSQKQTLPKKISTKYYQVQFSDTGLIDQIITTGGQRLLKADNGPGGRLKAMINDNWFDNLNGACDFYTGDVCYILERKTVLDTIPVLERYYFFKNENVIKVELEFDFDGNTIGYYWLDETKLNVYYPTCGHEVYHDIPYGFVQARQNRPLFATNWLYCGGLVYINRGTVKHWVKDDVIANVLAWGSKTFDNRIHFDFWTQKQQYDIRLYGKQNIEYFLIPSGTFNGSQIVHDVNDLVFPVFSAKGKGQKSFYKSTNNDLAVTAVFEKDGQVWGRGYKLPSENKSRYRDFEIFNCPLNEL